jgi:hypothetical protein
MTRLTPRTTAIGALIVAIGVGMTSNVLFLAAFQFRIDWFLEPTRLVGAGGTSAELLRWAAALDLIGYYLATGVLAYALWRLLRPRDPVVADLSALAAFGYTFVGGAGAAVLALVGPMLMYDHVAAAPVEQAVIATQFEILFETVWHATWQVLDAILLAAWWLGIGLLIRADQPGLARLSMALSAVAGAGAILTVLRLDLVRDIGLGLVFTLWTAWWIWLLVLFLRHDDPFASARDRAAGSGHSPTIDSGTMPE